MNAIEDYKSYLKDIIENKPYNHKPMDDLTKYYKILQEDNNENKNPAAPSLMLEFLQ
jgi:hypothetical protein